MKSLDAKTSDWGPSFAKKRNFGFEEVPSSCKGPETSMTDVELKGVAAGGKSSEICVPSMESSESAGVEEKGKNMEEGKFGNDESSESTTKLKCGSISLIGRRRAMEDAVTVAPGTVAGEFSFFAAYDGHGGARVANTCRDRLHKLLENEMETDSKRAAEDKQPTSRETTDGKGVKWNKVMAACFSSMDDEVLNNDRRRVLEEGGDEGAEGSTAVVVMVGKEELVVANCGDSRAVLGCGGVAMPLSIDHKPDRPDEKERVEAAGGRIIDWNGSRVQGVLATSRSIGDHYLKPYVISDPEVTVSKRTASDEFLIIATDGLWDVVSNEVACQVVRRCLSGQIRKKYWQENTATEAAVILAELAVAKGSRDNISVIVVDLKSLL